MLKKDRIVELKKSETNNCIVTTLSNVREHPNADRLKLATVLGTQVVVDVNSRDGDTVLYFDSNLCLSNVFLRYNNLYSNPSMNEDPSKKGYFGKNGRVKAQRFRQEVSNGYVADLCDLLNIPGVTGNDLPIGTEFTAIDGVEICSKYIVISKGTSGKAGKKRKSDRLLYFNKHWDTKHLMREKACIAPGPVWVEEKIHGTSGRTGCVQKLTNKRWWQFWKQPIEWVVISGTRRCEGLDGRHIARTRKEIEAKIAPKLYKGETIYYEIFGYDLNGSRIQKVCDYGCSPREYRVILYRVTITTPDGHTTDLSREQVYRRAEELELERPPLLYVGFLHDVQEVNEACEKFVEIAHGRSTFDANTLLEGIVVWFVDYFGKWNALKYKSEEFLMRESRAYDDGQGDIEDEL